MVAENFDNYFDIILCVLTYIFGCCGWQICKLADFCLLIACAICKNHIVWYLYIFCIKCKFEIITRRDMHKFHLIIIWTCLVMMYYRSNILHQTKHIINTRSNIMWFVFFLWNSITHRFYIKRLKHKLFIWANVLLVFMVQSNHTQRDL